MAASKAWQTAGSFALLFIAYQLPEAVGQRMFGSFRIQSQLFVVFFTVACTVGGRLAGNPFRAYALDGPWSVWRVTIAAFALAIACKLLTVAIGVSAGVFHPARKLSAPAADALLLGLLLTFIPSIAEDIVTRGFWFTRYGRGWSTAAFVAFSSVVYVLNHVFRLAAGLGEWLMLLSFGVAYGLAVARTKSLWPAVGLHWGWNFGNAIVAAAWPYAVISQQGGRLLAIAAHLVMAAAAWRFPGSGQRRRA